MSRAGPRAARHGVLACVLVALIAVGSTPGASANPSTVSGSTLYSFGSAVAENESNYTLYYSIPSLVQAGVSTNMTFFVYLTLLSGWKIQSQTQILEIIINTPTKQVVTQKAENNVTLYQGGRWGPFNMTLDLNDTQAGLSPGRVSNATVFADLIVYEAYDNPLYPFVQDSGATMRLADVEIAASAAGPSGGRLVESFAVGAVVVAALAGVSVATQRRERQVRGTALGQESESPS